MFRILLVASRYTASSTLFALVPFVGLTCTFLRKTKVKKRTLPTITTTATTRTYPAHLFLDLVETGHLYTYLQPITLLSPLQPHASPLFPPNQWQNGTVCCSSRANVSPGDLVEVVQKQHQSSGQLTTGVVSRLLTNSGFHPRGIKVCVPSVCLRCIMDNVRRV